MYLYVVCTDTRIRLFIFKSINTYNALFTTNALVCNSASLLIEQTATINDEMGYSFWRWRAIAPQPFQLNVYAWY